MSNSVFYQDFLFESLPVDEKDNPMVDVSYITNVADITDTEIITDSYKVSFNSLVEMTDEKAWLEFLESLEHYKSVVLIDDLPLQNNELLSYKEFYLKTYYFVMKKYCPNCHVYVN